MASGTVVRWLWVGLAVAGVSRGAVPADAAQMSRLPLRVLLWDHVGADSTALERTRHVVAGIFDTVGVELLWMDRPAFAEEMPTDPVERRDFVDSVIQVRLVSSADRTALRLKAGVLGAAQSGGRHAWIVFDLVQESAESRSVELAEMLGYVVAHEIGHLLLLPGHSLTGLMQERIDPRAIELNRALFLPAQARLIRAAVADLGIGRTDGGS